MRSDNSRYSRNGSAASTRTGSTAGVRWDRRDEQPVEYNPGGFWRRAFHRLDVTQKAAVLRRIDAARRQAGVDTDADAPA
jgi:hypothetical protein